MSRYFAFKINGLKKVEKETRLGLKNTIPLAYLCCYIYLILMHGISKLNCSWKATLPGISANTSKLLTDSPRRFTPSSASNWVRADSSRDLYWSKNHKRQTSYCEIYSEIWSCYGIFVYRNSLPKLLLKILNTCISI